MRSALCASAFVALTLLFAAGCGGAKPRARTVSVSPGGRTAAAIRSRLAKAGYTVQNDTYGAVIGAGPAKPRGMVAEFHVEVDFTSPNSFKFDVDVFDSHRDVERWLTSEHAVITRSLARCRLIPRCRLSLRRDGTPKLPTYRIVGPVFYSAATDNLAAKLSLPKFKALVALAAGLKTG